MVLTRGIYALNEATYIGYGDNTERWNGWYCPAFDKATARKILNDISNVEGTSFKWRYSGKNDSFVLAHGADGWEKYEVRGENFDTEVGKLRLYDIGYRCWCWEKVEDKPESPPQGREIIGQRIVGVRLLTKTEIYVEGWDGNEDAPALILENGTLLYPSRDEEGNGAGALFGNDNGNRFRIFPR